MDTNLLVQIDQTMAAVDVAVRHGYKPPAALLAAAAAYETARDQAAEDLADLAHEARTVTADGIPALLERMVDLSVRRGHVGPALGQLQGSLARRTITEAKAVAPHLVAVLAPAFNALADKFTDAYTKVAPVEWRDPAQLLDSGHEKVRAFEEARALIPQLDEIRHARDLLARTAPNGKAKGHDGVEAGTRYTEVTDSSTAAAVAQLLRANHPTPLGVWADLLEVDGVTHLRMLPIDEHAAYIATIPVAPVDQFPHKRMRVGGDFVGFSKTVR